MDFVLDTNRSAADGKLITAETFHAGMAAAVSSPFRVVPFFDPGVWGGQWMKQVCGLDDETENYAWCFDCVPEENSLLLDVAGELVELPSIDVVFTHPRELLGQLTYARFGAEFPIRFDFLDTMEGGNLSLQVHPLTDYIQDTFGMHYTQDESYYLLDAADERRGLPRAEDRHRSRRHGDLAEIGLPRRAELPRRGVHQRLSGQEARPLLHSRRAPCTAPARTRWCWRSRPRRTCSPSRCGTGTGSGWTGCRARSISSMPDATSSGTATRPGPGTTWSVRWRRWAPARAGWRSGPVCTRWSSSRSAGTGSLTWSSTTPQGTVNVLNLVEGAEAVVESPTASFAPFVVHYAETFIVPARVGRYRIRPHGDGVGHSWRRSRPRARHRARTRFDSSRLADQKAAPSRARHRRGARPDGPRERPRTHRPWTTPASPLAATMSHEPAMEPPMTTMLASNRWTSGASAAPRPAKACARTGSPGRRRAGSVRRWHARREPLRRAARPPPPRRRS